VARRKPPIRSRDLGIDLASGRERDLFRWFLACLLFGKPIQQEVARRAYVEFVRERLVTPEAIVDAGWDKLVEVLDRGHYVRYDFSTATKLLEVCGALVREYGTIANLRRRSKSRADLARRLQAFRGIGPTTTRIFLRDLPRRQGRRSSLRGGPPRSRRGAGGTRRRSSRVPGAAPP
jgi:hypothetical protein